MFDSWRNPAGGSEKPNQTEGACNWYDYHRTRDYPTSEGTASREPPKLETTFVNMTIAAPPKFDVLKYEGFRNELIMRCDMHGSVDDHVLISHLDVQCSDDTHKELLGVYMESTRGDREKRSFKTLLVALDRELSNTGQEAAVNKMHLRPRAEMLPEENPRAYCIRFGRIENSLLGSGVAIPDAMHFNKRLASMILSTAKMSTLLSD